MSTFSDQGFIDAYNGRPMGCPDLLIKSNDGSESSVLLQEYEEGYKQGEVERKRTLEILLSQTLKV